MDTALSRISVHLLSDEQLLELLSSEEDRLPRSVVDECVQRGDRMAELLTGICLDEEAWQAKGAAFWAPVHASFILAAFEDERALAGLLAALHASTEHDVDWVFGRLPSMLGSIGRPALADLRLRVTDVSTSDLERAIAVRALASLSARHPIHQGEILDFLRELSDDAEAPEDLRTEAAAALLPYARPGDRGSLLASAIRQEWGERPPRFSADEIRQVYLAEGAAPRTARQDWLAFYLPQKLESRQRRWREEAEDLSWSKGAEAEELWVDEERERFLTKFEFTLFDLGDAERGDALWVSESMTEYLVWYEGLAPWRWNEATSFAYLMDFFARRIALDDPGRIHAVPPSLLRFVRFCAGRGLVTMEDLKAVERCVESEREDFVGAAIDPERRRTARLILEQMLENGIDPRDPAGPGIAAFAPRERPTSRRLRKT